MRRWPGAWLLAMVGAAVLLGWLSLAWPVPPGADHSRGEEVAGQVAPPRVGTAGLDRPAPSAPRCAPGVDCLAWSRPLAGTSAGGGGGTDVEVVGERLVTVVGGRLVAFDLRDGTRTWPRAGVPAVEVRADPGGASSIAASDDVVVALTPGGRLAAVSATSGRVRWRDADLAVRELSGVHRYGDATVLVGRPLAGPSGPGRVDQVAYGLDSRTGAVAWVRRGDRVVLAESGPVLVRGGAVIGLDAAGGGTRWSEAAPGAVTAATSVADTVLLAVDRPPSLVLLDARSGATLDTIAGDATLEATAPSAAAPVVMAVATRVVVVEHDGSWWAADVPEGPCCGGHLVTDTEVVVQLTRDRLLVLERGTGARRQVVAAGAGGAWGVGGTSVGLSRVRSDPTTDRLTVSSVIDGQPLVELSPTGLDLGSTPDGRVVLVGPGYLAVLRAPSTPAPSLHASGRPPAAPAGGPGHHEAPPDGRMPMPRRSVESSSTSTRPNGDGGPT
jgi:hypothetical protein